MHAREVQTMINGLSNENVMVGIAVSGCKRARSKENAFNGDLRIVEHQTGTVEQTSGILSTQNQNCRFILNLLIGEKFSIVGRVGYDS